LNGQLAISIKDYEDINRRYMRGNPGAKRSWEEASRKWKGLQAQLSQTFKKWTPESLKIDYVYGDLRAKVQELGTQIEAVHELQTSFYDKEKTVEVEPQVTPAIRAAQAQAQALTKTLDDLSAITADHAKLPPRGSNP
jgi:hypothetical protein